MEIRCALGSLIVKQADFWFIEWIWWVCPIPLMHLHFVSFPNPLVWYSFIWSYLQPHTPLKKTGLVSYNFTWSSCGTVSIKVFLIIYLNISVIIIYNCVFKYMCIILKSSTVWCHELNVLELPFSYLPCKYDKLCLYNSDECCAHLLL